MAIEDDIPTQDPVTSQTGPDSPVPEVAAGAVDEAGPLRVPGYEVGEVIGRGGQGLVYRAIQISTQQPVAIKFIRAHEADRATIERFEREFRIHAQLAHPGIIKILDAGRITGPRGQARPYYIMELVRGAMPMDDYAREHGLDDEERVDLLLRAAEAVQYLHENSIVHLDLKPGNVLIDEQGNPRVGDFGISRLSFDTEALAGGTPGYEAPEQRFSTSKLADFRADVYALGAMLYELLSGEQPVPFEGADYRKRLCEEPPRRLIEIEPRTGRAIDAIASRALAKDPDDRFESTAAFVEALREATLPPAEQRRRVLRATRRRLARGAGVCFGLLLIVAVSVGLSLTVGRKLVFEWTPAHRVYAGMMGPPPPAVDSDLAHVVMFHLTPETDIPRIFEAAGLGVYDPADKYSQRAMHGWFAERFAAFEPSAIAYDIRFGDRPNSEAGTEAFAGSIREVESRGTHVVLGAVKWFFDAAGNPDFSPVLWAAGADPGGMHAYNPDGASRFDMSIAARSAEGEVRLSLALAAFCASRAPGATPRFEVRSDRAFLDIRYQSPAENRPDIVVDLAVTDRIELLGVQPVVRASPPHDLWPGDFTALFSPTMFPAESIDRATHDVMDLLDQDDDALRRAIAGKVVLIGDIRAGGDTLTNLGGRIIPGVQMHAMTIESLFRGAAFGSLGVPATVSAMGIAAGLGLLCPVVASRGGSSLLLRVGLLVLLVVVAMAGIVLVGLAAYRLEGLAVNPLPVALAIPIAAVLLLGFTAAGRVVSAAGIPGRSATA